VKTQGVLVLWCFAMLTSFYGSGSNIKSTSSMFSFCFFTGKFNVGSRLVVVAYPFFSRILTLLSSFCSFFPSEPITSFAPSGVV
jgi:hypothetical protein